VTAGWSLEERQTGQSVSIAIEGSLIKTPRSMLSSELTEALGLDSIVSKENSCNTLACLHFEDGDVQKFCLRLRTTFAGPESVL
jgi:hypothetical protein